MWMAGYLLRSASRRTRIEKYLNQFKYTWKKQCPYTWFLLLCCWAVAAKKSIPSGLRIHWMLNDMKMLNLLPISEWLWIYAEIILKPGPNWHEFIMICGSPVYAYIYWTNHFHLIQETGISYLILSITTPDESTLVVSSTTSLLFLNIQNADTINKIRKSALIIFVQSIIIFS